MVRTRRYWPICLPLLATRRKGLRNQCSRSAAPIPAEEPSDKPCGLLASAGRILAILGAAYTLGSTLWLFRYGPRMLHFCASTPWLGKSVHRMIQADALPDYFAFQAFASMLVLVGHACVGRTSLVKGKRLSATWIVVAIAVASALANMLALGPMTVQLVETWPAGAPALEFKRRFSIVHGMSMLLNMINLLASTIFIVLTA